MFKKTSLIIISLAFFVMGAAYASPYGKKICNDPGYTCYKAKKGDTWTKLFPHPIDRDLVKRVNRVNIPLYAGSTIAIPNDLIRLDKLDLAPFPAQIPSHGKKVIYMVHDLNAWGAYDKQGKLVNWGPAAGGKDFCKDVNRACKTKRGTFYVYYTRGEFCKSSKFPVATRWKKAGGAPMPYCMFFSGGYALHGSDNVPGRHASHGCVRMYPEDAEWLHEQFVTIPKKSNGYEKTLVIVN